MSAIDLPSLIPLPWQSTQWRRLRLQLNDNQLAHAYLLAGASGLGKAEFAAQFARLVLCEKPDAKTACNTCKNCINGKNGFHPDVVIVSTEEGARDIKIDQIRALAEFLSKTSHAGGAKIAIINHAHQMNNSAANALLKTLEEPTPGSYLFLNTDSPGSLSATIRSRCQKLQFQNPDFDAATDWLQELLGNDVDSIKLLAAANNRPLIALELAGDGNLNAREEFVEQICRELNSEQALQELVSSAQKLGETIAIECLLETLSILIKRIVREEPNSTKENSDATHSLQPAIQELLVRLTVPGREKRNLQSLVRFHAKSLESWQQLRGGTNPNPQLILESLFWQWRTLPLHLS